MENVFLAPQGFQKDDPNPFTQDGSYDASWTILIIDEHTQWEMFQGKTHRGGHAVIMSPHPTHFEYRFADFIQYEAAHGRKILLSAEKPRSLEFSSHYKESTVRPCDPPLLVHGTLLDTYEMIIRDGFLKSADRLKREGVLVHPVGLAPLGEPQDYLEYVMFAKKGLAPEFVTNARLAGSIICDPDMPYAPQVRMYFDGHQLVRDGLITRDLTSKVHDQVPLDPYLLGVVTAEDVLLPQGQAVWTPRTFADAADALIEGKYLF